MTWRSRLRVLKAAIFQTWHERQCPECRMRWMESGRDNGLLRSCAECEAEAFEEYLERLEGKFQSWQRSERVQ